MNRLFTASLLLVFAPLAAGAQDVPQPRTLTLEDALRLAHTGNPEYRQTLNDADVSAVAVRQGWAAFLPSASASLGFGLSSNTSLTGTDDFGKPVRLPDPLTFRSSSASQGISLNTTLFDGGAMFRRLAAVRAEDRATEASIVNADAVLVMRVTTDFYAAVRAARIVEVEQHNLESARTRLAQTQAQFRIAAVSQVEVLGAQRDVLSAEQRIARAKGEARKAVLTLGQTLGLEGDAQIEPARELPPIFDPSTLDADALVARALTSNPLVRRSAAMAAAAGSLASAAHGSRWPTISAGFGFDRGQGEQGYGAFGELNPAENRGFSFRLSASVPLFNRFQTSHQIAQAEAQREDAQQEQRRIRLQVERDVRAALVDLQVAHEALRLATENARISQQQLDLAEEQFRVGALNFLQLQQLVDANSAAQREAVDAQFTFLTARAALEQHVGAPLNP